MIIAGELLLPRTDDPKQPVGLVPGYVRVEGQTIAEVVRCPPPKQADLGGPGRLIAPGLIDTHVHLPQFGVVGAHGFPLLEWLERVVFPAEAAWAEAPVAAAQTRQVARQLLAHGTTAICAYGTVHHGATIAAINELSAAGLRGVAGLTMSDRNAPNELRANSDQLLDETADLLDRFPPGSRMAAAITPRFAVSCSEQLLRGAARLAAAIPEATIQTHLSETCNECRLVGDLFEEKAYAQVYSDAGLLTPRTLLGHGVWSNAAESKLLAESDAVVAHCPTANAFLRSGDMHRAELVAAGVRLSLGSDIGAGYERSMVRVARAMVDTASRVGDSYPNAAQAWSQITADNADAAGMHDAGRIVVGAPADLIVVKPNVPWLESNADPLAMLLWAWDDRWLKATLCRGAVVYAGS